MRRNVRWQNIVRDPTRTGLSRHDHHLGYGMGFGFLLWAPDWVKHGIVHLWNAVSCTLMGHDHLVQEKEGGPVECVSCMRAVPDPGTDMVIREWKLWEEETEP